MRRSSAAIPPSFAFVLLATAPLLAAQQVPKTPLGPADVEAAETFDQVAGIRELRDGRLLVADRAAKALWLVDLAAGTQKRLGREGSGPGEYQMPAGLVALPGDTTLLLDPLQQRTLLIHPDGTLGAQLRPPEEAGLFGGFKAADRQGRLYASGSPIRLGAPGGAMTMPEAGMRADTMPIMRWTRGGKVDTLGRVQGPMRDLKVSGSQGRMQVNIRQMPMSPQEDWHVAPDGRVAIVHHQPYRVEWIGTGAPVLGPVVNWTPVKVSKGDRDLFEAARRNPANRMVVTRGGGGGNAPPPPSVGLGDVTFPETKPPFVERSAIMAPTGELWVQRSVAFGQPSLYDVFDGQGRLVRQVELVKRARVVGFGAKSVYVVRVDDDDLQVLGRYALK